MAARRASKKVYRTTIIKIRNYSAYIQKSIFINSCSFVFQKKQSFY